MTGAQWVRYTYGPMAKALVPSTQVMDGHEIEVTTEPVGRYDARVYRPGPAPRFRPHLAAEEREALDRIIALVRPLSTGDAISLAYNTAPMRFLQRIEAETGQLQLDVEIPFDLDERAVADARHRSCPLTWGRSSPSNVRSGHGSATSRRRRSRELRGDRAGRHLRDPGAHRRPSPAGTGPARSDSRASMGARGVQQGRLSRPLPGDGGRHPVERTDPVPHRHDVLIRRPHGGIIRDSIAQTDLVSIVEKVELADDRARGTVMSDTVRQVRVKLAETLGISPGA